MRTRNAARLVLAAAAAGAGAVHLAAVPPHVGESRLLALGFAATAVAQVAWALVAVVRGDRAWLLVGAALQAGVLTAYVASRTVGLPGLAPEAVGRADLLCCALEAAVLTGTLALAARPGALRGRVRARAAAVLSAAVVGVGATTGVALASPLHAHSDGHGHSPSTSERTAHDDPRTEAVETGADANGNGVDDGVEDHFRRQLLDAHGAHPPGHADGSGEHPPGHQEGGGHEPGHGEPGHHAGAYGR